MIEKNLFICIDNNRVCVKLSIFSYKSYSICNCIPHQNRHFDIAVKHKITIAF